MEKYIAVIIPHKGLGDIIFHNSFIESIFKHHKKRIILFANKSTKANFIYKKNKYIKRVILIDLHRPSRLFYLSKIIQIFLKLNKFKYKKIYYTGSHKWHLIPLKILSRINKIELNYIVNNKKLIVPFLEYFLKKINIKYHKNFNMKIIEDVSKKFVNIIKNKPKPWVFLSIDTSEDQIQIPSYILIKIINKLKNKYKTIFINTNNKNSHKLNFLNDSKIIKTNSYNVIEIYYIIKRSKLYVGNESGPANISSILNKKAIIFVNNNVLIESSKLPDVERRIYFNIEKIIKKEKIILNSI